MAQNIRIAIDGPSGAGKSTIAKILAKKLSIEYIDTGAMYRSVALKMENQSCDLEEKEKIKNILSNTDIDFRDGKVFLDGEFVGVEIRKNYISEKAAKFSQNIDVRSKLVEIQKKIAQSKSVVMDGRDIGTNVIPDAELKIFLTADPEERANRRFLELKEKGESISFDKVLADIKKRDFEDINRDLNPLKKDSDAIEVDTTGKNIEEVVEEIYSEAKNIV